MRKPDFCKCKKKKTQNSAADQRPYFRYVDSTIPLLPKSEISSLFPCSVAVQPGLCQTLSETMKTGLLATRLILHTWVCLITDPSGNPRAFLTFDNCCENSSNFCCSGVLSVSVSIISFRILPEIQNNYTCRCKRQKCLA